MKTISVGEICPQKVKNQAKKTNQVLKLLQMHLLIFPCCLTYVPVLDEFVGNDNLINLDEIIIEIEEDVDRPTEVVDENDAGENVIAVNNCNNLPALFNADEDVTETLNFLENGCGCKTNCCRQFHADKLTELRRNCAEVDYYQDYINKLDQIILAKLDTLTRSSEITARSHYVQNIRVKARCSYLLHGLDICRETFLFAHNIKIKRFKRLTKIYNLTGLLAKTHWPS